jgi:serine/threonine protein kinase
MSEICQESQLKLSDFLVLKELGKGGFGQVHLARTSDLCIEKVSKLHNG